MSLETVRINAAVERVSEPVISAGRSCDHVMALHLDPRGDGNVGIVRCIVERTGDVDTAGFVDRSQIHTVEMATPFEVTRGPELAIEGSGDVVHALAEGKTFDFLGLEDPNLWSDDDGETLHFYATIAFIERHSGDTCVYLGHAEGEDVFSLRMTDPVLRPIPGDHSGAKEVAIAPETADGHRYNLVESSDTVDGTAYSVLRTARADDLGGPWEYEDLAFHPAHDGYEWCAGHVSPGPFLPEAFADLGGHRVVGILNGREANRLVHGEIRYGEFAVGLLVYDYEAGVVEWVSEEPFLRDPDAETITFASAFRPLDETSGVLYAHVDDSYVSAYRVNADGLASYLPEFT